MVRGAMASHPSYTGQLSAAWEVGSGRVLEHPHEPVTTWWARQFSGHDGDIKGVGKREEEKGRVDISFKVMTDGALGRWLNSCQLFAKQARRPAFDLRNLCLTSRTKSQGGAGVF